MNLIIDRGNASSKVAVFDGRSLVASFIFKQFDTQTLESLFGEYNFTRGICSSVIDTGEDIIDFLRSELPHFIFLDETVAVPVAIEYQTPRTLGKDRLAAIVGANFLYPDRDVLVIDAGTAITYELIDKTGTFLGGNISPGMTTRFRALHAFTQKLPLLTEAEEVPLLGTSTTTAVQAGVINGIVYEMDGYIDNLKKNYPELLVFLTGGHSFYFERRLKNSIFADINLVLTGLNRILEYNVES